MESSREKTVVALYDNFSEAQRVVQDLVDHGFPRNNISMVASDYDGTYADYLAREEDTDDVDAAQGAGFGAIVGGLTGLLVSLGALAIPGIGPVLVAGPVAATLIGAGVGAVTGGLLAALVDLGVPEEEAGYYAEGVRRGGTLVTLAVPEDMTDRAIEIMDNHDPVDIEERVSAWQSSGWTGFDPDAQPYDRVDRTTDRLDTPAYTSPAIEREGGHYGDFSAYNDRFNSHYNTYYTNSGYDYDQYVPAYRYGYYLAIDDRYHNYDWDRIEPEARRYWETNEQGTWEDFKDAVRHAWQEVKEAVGAEDYEHRDDLRQTPPSSTGGYQSPDSYRSR